MKRNILRVVRLSHISFWRVVWFSHISCWRAVCLSIFFSIFACVPSFAGWQVMLTNYLPSDYSAGTQNWQIVEHQNGRLYAANNYGLLEFDGERWRLYGIWNSSPVRSLCVGDGGEIYVGGTNLFGVFRPNEYGQLSFHPLSSKVDSVYANFGEVWNIFYHDGQVYVQTRNYIFMVDKEEQVSVLTEQDYIYCSTFIRNGLYIASTSGIYFLIGSQLHQLAGADMLSNYNISALVPYIDNGILIATEMNGLFLYDGKQIAAFHTAADSFICKNQLFSLSIDVVNDKIALGTVRGGVAMVDLYGRYLRTIDQSRGLQNNTVLSMSFNKYGDLWVGLDQGISRIEANSPITLYHARHESYGSCYSSCRINDYLYLGTNQGMYKVRLTDDRNDDIAYIRLLEGTEGQTWSIDTIGETIFCSHHNGLFEIVGDTPIPVITEIGCWKVRQIGERVALVGSYNGFYLIEKKENSWVQRSHVGGFNETAYQFETDALGNIYVTSNEGLKLLNIDIEANTFTSTLIYRRVNANDYISINRIGDELLICGDYFCRRVDREGQIGEDKDFFRSLDGERFYSLISKDDRGNVFYITDNHLKCKSVDLERNITIMMPDRFYFIDGFPNIAYIDNMTIAVGGTMGVERVKLDELENLYAYYSAQELGDVPYVGQLMVTTPHDSLILVQTPIASAEGLVEPKIRYENNDIRVFFASNVNAAGKVEYSACLDPYDKSYSDWQRSTQREYTNLHEGKYTLHLRMRHIGEEEYTETAVVFHVLPPWYRTWWAWTLWIVLLLVLLAFFVSTLRQRLNHEKERIKRDKERALAIQEQRHLREVHEQEKRILMLENEKTNYELKQKSQELSNVMLNQANRNELVAEVQEDLRRVADDLKIKNYDSARLRVQELQGKLSNNAGEVDWSRFEENFDIVNDQFLQRLSARYPWLSKSERKLCVYIKMGLYTKEIAPLMNISTRGVEMMRYRMRKKMGLERDANLEIFFNSLDADLTKP